MPSFLPVFGVNERKDYIQVCRSLWGSLWGRTTVSCVRREGREDWEGGQESGGDWGRGGRLGWRGRLGSDHANDNIIFMLPYNLTCQISNKSIFGVSKNSFGDDNRLIEG